MPNLWFRWQISILVDLKRESCFSSSASESNKTKTTILDSPSVPIAPHVESWSDPEGFQEVVDVMKKTWEFEPEDIFDGSTHKLLLDHDYFSEM